MYKKINKHIQINKIFSKISWPYLSIFILSLIPIFYTWGKFAIGGDTMVPFGSSGLEKYLYQWISLQNGQYFSINYYPLYIFYNFFELIRLDIYQISSLLLFLLNIAAGFGIYRLAKLFYPNEKSYLYIIPIAFYLLSPALLNGWHYLYIYSFIPWFFYFIFKTIKNKEIRISDIIWLNILLFFSSVDLPNPKYIFHIYFILLAIFFLSLLFKLIDFKFFYRNLWKFIIFILLSVYLFLPLGYFATHYTPATYGVHAKSGYKDKGEMMDFGSATIDKMFRLHHNGLAFNTSDQEVYKSNTFIILLSYVFIVLIAWNLFFVEYKIVANKENYKFQIILFILILLYLCFAAGSNPPFGFMYEYLVSNFSLFAFLRTTAGAVFFLSPLYAVLLLGFIRNIKKLRPLVVFLLLVSIGAVSYPLWNGIYYKNFNTVNQYTDRNEYGFRIPDEYFKVSDLINTKKLDAKILFPQSNLSYINTEWGFFGPVIYQFLYSSYNIGYDAIYSNINNHNVGFAFLDDSLIDVDASYADDGAIITKENFISFLSLSRDNFLPHFYTPKTVITTSQGQKVLKKIVLQEGYDVRSLIYFDGLGGEDNGLAYDKDDIIDYNELKKEPINNDSVVEFKKINPTKYRVIIHRATGKFPLVFSEAFNEGWKIYPTDYHNDRIDLKDEDYKAFEGNDGDQAGLGELREFIDKGYISYIGDLKEKENKYYRWKNNKEIIDHKGVYNIDFISKNFQGTIQNDNLSNGIFYETWFESSIGSGADHRLANGYANSWMLDTDKICKNNFFCYRNNDGTYDMEMVVEFWPQRLFYIGSFISGVTLFGCLGYLGWVWAVKMKNKKTQN